jgi:hypothetical protein
MDATIKGCATAAERIGYHHFAELIIKERIRPEHIASLFKLSASHGCSPLQGARSNRRP